MPSQPIRRFMTAWIIACVFGAAVVRGYSGLGLSVLAMTALSLALVPVEIVDVLVALTGAQGIANLHGS